MVRSNRFSGNSLVTIKDITLLGEIGLSTRNNQLDFGSDLDMSPDLGFFFFAY